MPLWHTRIGHTNPRALHRILAMCNIPFNNKKSHDFFQFGSLAKSHRLFAALSINEYITLFELIYTYQWGPSQHLPTMDTLTTLLL